MSQYNQYGYNPPPRRTALATVIPVAVATALFMLARCQRQPSQATKGVSIEPPPTESVVAATTDLFSLDLPTLDFDPATLPRNPHLTSALADHHQITNSDLLRALTRTTELLTPHAPGDGSTPTRHREARIATETALFGLTLADFADTRATGIKRVLTEHLFPSFAPDFERTRYDSACISLADIREQGCWQCTSGTLLFSLTALRLPANILLADHLVLIYERGHVLPGFVQRRNGAWELIGVEMTVLGKGLKYYGPTADLATAGFALRIVRAPEAWTLQAAAPFLRNAGEVARHILRHTAEQYDLPLAGLEANLRETTLARTEHDPVRAAIVSPWAFGTAEVPPGPRPMLRLDHLDPRNRHLSFTALLALLPPDARSDNPENPYPEPNGRSGTPEGTATLPPGSPGEGGRIVYPWDPDYPH